MTRIVFQWYEHTVYITDYILDILHVGDIHDAGKMAKWSRELVTLTKYWSLLTNTHTPHPVT